MQQSSLYLICTNVLHMFYLQSFYYSENFRFITQLKNCSQFLLPLSNYRKQWKYCIQPKNFILSFHLIYNFEIWLKKKKKKFLKIGLCECTKFILCKWNLLSNIFPKWKRIEKTNFGYITIQIHRRKLEKWEPENGQNDCFQNSKHKLSFRCIFGIY